MKLQIISVTDKRYNTELEIDENCCVLDLKDKLTVQDARVIYAGKLLQDTQILKETIKQENNYVHLVFKQPLKEENVVDETPKEVAPEVITEPQSTTNLAQENSSQRNTEPLIAENLPLLTNSLPFSYSLVPIQPQMITIK